MICIISSLDSRSELSVTRQWVLPVISNDIIPVSRNSDPEYCRLSEQWNPVRKKRQKILLLCPFWGRPDSRGPPHCDVSEGLTYAAVCHLEFPRSMSACHIFRVYPTHLFEIFFTLR